MTLRDHVISNTAKGSLNQTAFRPAILLDPPRVLFSDPRFELQPALNFLTSVQILSPQCYRTIDLPILTVLRKLVVQICPSHTYGLDLTSCKINGWDLLRDFGFREFQLSKPFSLMYFNLPSWRSANTCPPNQRPCLYFGWSIFQLDQWSCLYFGWLIFQLDERYCVPLLDQRPRSPLGFVLLRYQISNSTLFTNGFYPKGIIH